MVLVIILGAFSSILLQCKRVVGAAEAVNRATSRIQAIGQVIHLDMGRINKGAVLKISSGGDAMLIVTGDFSQSRTSESDGVGSAIYYSVVGNAAGHGDILRRASFVLSKDGTGDDVISKSLQDIRTSSDAGAVIGAIEAKLTGDLSAPAVTFEEVSASWPILDYGITDLVIEWTDGSISGTGDNAEMGWYGNNPPAKYSSVSSSGFLWTAKHVGLWPKAIRVTFTLTNDDPQLPDELRVQTCQYICEIVH